MQDSNMTNANNNQGFQIKSSKSKSNNYLDFRVHVAPHKLEGIAIIWEMF